MSAISFSFRPEALPAYAQAEFLNRFFQLVLEYQYLTAPVPPSPAAEDLPSPSEFQSVEGDEPAPVKKVRKNPWADLTEEQRAERLAAMKRGRERKAAERRLSADSLEAPPSPSAAVTAPVEAARSLEDMTGQELRDLWASLVGKPSGLTVSHGFPTKMALINEIRRLQGAAAPSSSAEDAASETSAKKPRKNPWADLTEEQKAERIAKMQAARAAKKAEKAAALTAAATGSV